MRATVMHRTKGKNQFVVNVGEGWRVVSGSSYVCPFLTSRTDGGLTGRISLNGKRVKVAWRPNAPISPNTICEGELTFL